MHSQHEFVAALAHNHRLNRIEIDCSLDMLTLDIVESAGGNDKLALLRIVASINLNHLTIELNWFVLEQLAKYSRAIEHQLSIMMLSIIRQLCNFL